MKSDTFTLYKLIILYILDKVDFPLTNARLSNFILEKEYTTYFNIQQALSELAETKLISSETKRNSTFFKITKMGQETLYLFEEQISKPIKKDIIDFLTTNHYDLRDEVATTSDYYQLKPDEYIVRCQVKEKESLIIDLTLTTPSDTEAERMCSNWNKKSQSLYSYIMQSLLSDSKEE